MRNSTTRSEAPARAAASSAIGRAESAGGGFGRPLPAPSRAELEALFHLKYGAPETTGWGPRMRWRAGYFNPDDHYEALLMRLVTGSTRWLDVGCGRHLLSPTGRVAEALSRRCARLVGVDPSETLLENPYVHEKVRASILDFETDERFDLITLRMVAEHLDDPPAVAKKLAGLMRPGALLVIYTVYRWSPASLAARLVPFALHRPVKWMLWRTEAVDNFPVFYRMNTRRRLRGILEPQGFRESLFRYLDDCRSTGRFKTGQRLEIGLFRLLRAAGLRYPELCLLGAFERAPS